MRSERFGLAVVAVCVAVSLIVSGLLLDHRRDLRAEQSRAHGSALVRLLARMPVEALTQPRSGSGPIELVGRSQGNPDFAYLQVLTSDGVPLAEAAAPGVVPPVAPVGSAPSEWIGERRLAADGGGDLTEYLAPVVEDGQRVAQIRIGYRAPTLAPRAQDLPLLAWLCLPVFLIAPAFYYLMRHEFRPLQAACARLRDALEGAESGTVDLKASGVMGDFVRNFNRLAEATEARMQSLEHERSGVLTRTHVLSYQKARIESVLRSLPQGIMVLDESAAVTYVNEKVGAFLGVDLTEVEGKRPDEWCTHAMLRQFLASYDHRGRVGNPGGSLEFSPDDQPSTRIAATAYPLFAPRSRDEILGTLVVLDDITAEVLARQARQELIAQLSHELKTPLHVIGMYGEMLLDESDGANEIQIEAGNVIHDEVERVVGLINNMLSISRLEMGNLQINRVRTRVQELLDDAVSSVGRAAADRGIEVKVEPGPDTLVINVDKELLRVAVNNLLTNAIKYNRDHGKVVTGVRDEGDHIEVYVTDSGIGIAAEDRERIFEKFYRAEDPAAADVPGHGLGLPLAREIARLHHGDISVVDGEGGGSEFIIRLTKTPVLLKEAV